MVNGKIILGSLSIIAASILFFDVLGQLRSNVENLMTIPILGTVLFGIIGITAVRSGLQKKRKTS
jgi:hypothetical protein